MQAAAFAPLHAFLILLSGVFVAGVAVHAFRARRSESPGVHWFLSMLCLLPAAYLLANVLEYDATTLRFDGLVRSSEAAIGSVFLIVYPWFLVHVTRLKDRVAPAVLSGIGLIMFARSVTSPTGLWLKRIDSLRPERLPWGESIEHAYGQPSPWILYTLTAWTLLTVYGIVCALRYRRYPGAVGASALVVFHSFFFVAIINDMLIDAGYLHSIGLAIFCAPILVIGMWWRQALEESRRATALRELVLESAEALIVQDAHSGLIRETNKAACTILARSSSSLVGASLGSLIVDHDRERFAAATARAADGNLAQAAIVEVRCIKASGEEFPTQMFLRSTVLESRAAIVVSMRDVSDLKRVEEDKVQLALQMLHAQRLESLGLLAGGVAHDFNNIMTAILGRLDLSMALVGAGTVRNHLTEAAFAVRRAADLCQQMLVYAGKGTPQVGAIDVSKVVEEMGRMLEVTVAKSITLESDLSQSLPAIRGDANQIRQVVMNLITNAADAIGTGAGRIVLATRRVDVTDGVAREFVNGPPCSEECVVFEVADNGCGMDDKTKKRIFEPFFTTKFTGRGLGMSAVLGIVRDHGGAIQVDSAIGSGTRVAIYLPALEHQSEVQPASGQEDARQWRGRILLIDDDDQVRALTASMLGHLGFDTREAGSGQRGLQLAADPRQSFDVIVLDLTMPDMDGISVLGELRQRRIAVPVILTSGFSSVDVSQWLGDQAQVQFLQKPYDLQGLRQAIAQTPGITEQAGR